jgi:hypothetical protein
VQGDVEAAAQSDQETTPHYEPLVPKSKKNINNYLFYTNQIKSQPNGVLFCKNFICSHEIVVFLFGST